MALKPIINVQNTIFDANKDFLVQFSWSGNQMYNVRLLAINLSSGETYDKTIGSTDYAFNLPAGSLTKGNSYTFQIQLSDADGNMSDLSDKVIFKCITAPTFKFGNITSSSVIDKSQYSFLVNYNQAEGELLKEYKFYLYNESGNELSNSGILYSSSADVECQISYLITGLENSTSYYIYCEGVTVGGYKLKTDKIYFSVQYGTSSTFSLLKLENDKNTGCIKYSSHINLIEGVATNGATNIDGVIDLQDGSLIYEDSFTISDDFVLCSKINGFYVTEFSTSILEVKNETEQLALVLNDYGDYQCFKLTVTSGSNEVIIYSDHYTLNENTVFTIWVKKVGIYYDLIIETE